MLYEIKGIPDYSEHIIFNKKTIYLTDLENIDGNYYLKIDDKKYIIDNTIIKNGNEYIKLEEVIL